MTKFAPLDYPQHVGVSVVVRAEYNSECVICCTRRHTRILFFSTNIFPLTGQFLFNIPLGTSYWEKVKSKNIRCAVRYTIFISGSTKNIFLRVCKSTSYPKFFRDARKQYNNLFCELISISSCFSYQRFRVLKLNPTPG